MASQPMSARVAAIVFATGALTTCAAHRPPDRLGWDATDHENARRCEAGVSASCSELGRRLIAHTERQKDLERGLVLLEVACGQDDLAACTALATFYAQVKPHAPRTLARARDLAGRACQRGAAAACTELGEVVFFEDPERQDQSQASQAFNKGCAMGDARGCELQGLMELRNHLSGDKAIAEQAFAAACGMRRLSSCHRLALLRLEKPATRSQGVALLSDNCDHGYATSCGFAALLVAPLLRAEASCPQALRFAQRACAGNDVDGCMVADVCSLDGEASKAVAARGRLRAGCARDMALACLYWADGEEAAARGGANQQFDAEAVRRAYMVACRADREPKGISAIACPRLAAIDLMRVQNAQEAEALIATLREECDGSSGEACCSLASAHRTGKWVPADPGAERELRARACSLGCERCCR